jgi:hypothetical protein
MDANEFIAIATIFTTAAAAIITFDAITITDCSREPTELRVFQIVLYWAQHGSLHVQWHLIPCN